MFFCKVMLLMDKLQPTGWYMANTCKYPMTRCVSTCFHHQLFIWIMAINYTAWRYLIYFDLTTLIPKKLLSLVAVGSWDTMAPSQYGNPRGISCVRCISSPLESKHVQCLRMVGRSYTSPIGTTKRSPKGAHFVLDLGMLRWSHLVFSWKGLSPNGWNEET